MDPATAIGLVASIISIIDFGYELVGAGREIHHSLTGSTTENDRIEYFSTRMEATAADLVARNAKYGASSRADEQRLTELADECLGLCGDLRKLLEKLRTQDPKSKRKVIASAARNLWKKGAKNELEARLDRCRSQLHFQLSHTSWFVASPPAFDGI